MDELPVCKKCCFCVPLRYGLLTWGYMKLITAILVLSFFLLIVLELAQFIPSVTAIITMVSAVLSAEIVIHIIFIVGAHKKIVKLLRLYFYYAIFMWVITILTAIVCTILLILVLFDNRDPVLNAIFFSIDVVGFLFSIVIQTFLLLSLRSEIIKLRSNCPYRFVKNDKDPEGTISTVNYEEEMYKENGTERIFEMENS